MVIKALEKIGVMEYVDLTRSPYNGITNLIRGMLEYEEVNWTIYEVKISGVKDFVEINPNISRVTLGKLPKMSWWKFRLPNSLYYSVLLLKNRKHIDVDVFHAHRIEIGFICTLLYPKIPLIQFIHNSREDLTSFERSSSFWRFLPAIHESMSKFVYRRAFRVLMFNENEYECTKEHFHNVFRCFTSFDSLVFWPKIELKAKDASVLKRELRLVWMGRFENEKNPLLALEIAKELQKRGVEFELNLIGYGSQLMRLKNEIKISNLTNKVRILSRLSRASIANELRESDVFLQTSLYEGSPTAILEALGCGVPVLSTLQGDPDKLIKNGFNGFVVEDLNPVQFAGLIPVVKELDRTVIAESVSHRSSKVIRESMISLIKLETQGR